MGILEQDQNAADHAKSRGILYALLAWAWRYPDEKTISTLRALLPRCLNGSVSGCLDGDSQQALGSLAKAFPAEDCLDLTLSVRYGELFGHAVRGTCPLYELEYGQAEIVQQAGELADIAGFYNAFGLECTPDSMERVDHAAVECEFMSVLCAKYAIGILSNNAELTNACFDGQRTFLRDHLARWMPALCSRVSKADDDGVYGQFARLGASLLASECEAFGVAAGPEYLELRSVDPQADTEIQCGPAGGDQLVPLTIGGMEANGD